MVRRLADVIRGSGAGALHASWIVSPVAGLWPPGGRALGDAQIAEAGDRDVPAARTLGTAAATLRQSRT
jgi:hypothetical protein